MILRFYFMWGNDILGFRVIVSDPFRTRIWFRIRLFSVSDSESTQRNTVICAQRNWKKIRDNHLSKVDQVRFEIILSILFTLFSLIGEKLLLKDKQTVLLLFTFVFLNLRSAFELQSDGVFVDDCSFLAIRVFTLSCPAFNFQRLWVKFWSSL